VGAPAIAGSVALAGHGAIQASNAIVETGKLSNVLMARGNASQGHHPWPQYLGGPKNQPLLDLPTNLHEKFHAGLDKIFARGKGKVDWKSLTPAQQQDILTSILTYSQEFDADYGTKTFDAVVNSLNAAGVPLPPP
jgi:hypothetical protein